MLCRQSLEHHADRDTEFSDSREKTPAAIQGLPAVNKVLYAENEPSTTTGHLSLEGTYTTVRCLCDSTGQRRYVFGLSVQTVLTKAITQERLEGISSNLAQLFTLTEGRTNKNVFPKGEDHCDLTKNAFNKTYLTKISYKIKWGWSDYIYTPRFKGQFHKVLQKHLCGHYWTT